MNSKKLKTKKKKIFLPSLIGDWTSYSFKKHHEAISISKSVDIQKKKISEKILDQLLIFHYEFFDNFFKSLTTEINSFIDLESVSIESLTQKEFKESTKDEVYQCKFSIPNIQQLDFTLDKKSSQFICHRLCGGSIKPETFKPLTNVEISLMSIINTTFISLLHNNWKQTFEYSKDNYKSHIGYYKKSSKQSDKDTLIIITANFRLFDEPDLTINILYSLDTIETLLDQQEKLNKNIVENMSLSNNILNNTKIPFKSIIGKTTITINDLHNLDIGDVIVLENQPITHPVQLIFKDSINFDALPVKIENNKIGLQITRYNQYDQFKRETSKPLLGTYTITESDDVSRKPETTPPETATASDNIEHPLDSGPLDAEPLDAQPSDAEPLDNELFVEEPTEITDSVTTENIIDNVDNDEDFLWDDDNE